MAINKVWIIEGCISCGLCEEICPEVFKQEDVALSGRELIITVTRIRSKKLLTAVLLK